jgi:hypothetical protein
VKTVPPIQLQPPILQLYWARRYFPEFAGGVSGLSGFFFEPVCQLSHAMLIYGVAMREIESDLDYLRIFHGKRIEPSHYMA